MHMVRLKVRLLAGLVAICLSVNTLAQQSLFMGGNAGVQGGNVGVQGGMASTPGSTASVGAAIPSPQLPSLRMSNGLSSKATATVAPTILSPIDRVLLEDELRSRRGRNEKSEFQKFVAETTGKDLAHYGSEFFAYRDSRVPGLDSTQRPADDRFAPVEAVPVSSDYVVGPGDELLIRTWGQLDADLRVQVDRNGAVNIPKVGVVSVAGVRFQDLRSYLVTAFGLVYRNFDLSVSLGQLRATTVFVVGQVSKPGSYALSPMSTVVNALYAAGGPSAKGSMRRIQVKRGDKLVAELDLYDLLLKGDKSKDIKLTPGDVIHVPPVGPLVAVAGSVNSEAIFELKDKESSLQEVLDAAGGLSTLAEGRRVTIDRIENRKVRLADEFALDEAGLRKNLRDGDIVNVFAVTPRFENTVTLAGFVAQPSRYPWREGMRVKDLIPEKEALVSKEYWLRRNFATLPAKVVQERLLQDKFNQNVLSVTDPTSGEKTMVANGKIEEFAQDSRVFERRLAVLGARGDTSKGSLPGEGATKPLPEIQLDFRPEEINWDVATVERLLDDLSYTLVPFNLGKAILKEDPQHNLLLKPGDIVTVYSKSDVRVSVERKRRFVRLEGEVVNPGIYPVEPGETLRQLVARVGGLTPQGYLYGAEFARESTRIQQQKKLDEYMERLERDSERAITQLSQSATTAEQAASMQSQVQSQRGLLDKLKRIKATGRVVLEVPPGSNRVADLPDIGLEDGDRLLVPPKPSTISVVGSVYSENAFIYRPEKRIGDYLGLAGGPTYDGDGSSIYVLRADGSVISKRQSGWISLGGFDSETVLPGDAIIVPEKFDKTTLAKSLKDWTQILYQFALGVAGLKVLRD